LARHNLRTARKICAVPYTAKCNRRIARERIYQGFRMGCPSGHFKSSHFQVLYRLGAPLRWFRGTTAHIVALELYNLPRRIAASRERQFHRLGILLPSDPRQNSPLIAFELACNGGMERLRQDFPFCLSLEQALYARGFREGAEYALGSECIHAGKEGALPESISYSLPSK